MRILVVNWQDRENPQAGGAEEHLHETFGRLARRGHEVTLLVSGWPGCARHRELDGMVVHRTGGRHTFPLAAPRHFLANLRDAPFDVVVEDLNKVPLFTPAWTRVPVVLLVHHLFGGTAFQEASLPVAAATWLLERPVPRVFAGAPVVAVSRSTRDDLVHRGMDGAHIEVVPNGVDLDRYAPDPSVGRFEEPTVLYLGRLKRYKRVDLVLRAVAALGDTARPPRLVVAGDGDHRAALRSLASKLGLDGRVEFAGRVDEARKVELFRRCWVHVLTSPKEGWGITNMEAAACGTATVASDAPGLRESVLDGATGFLVPHGDVPALAARVGALLADPSLRDRLGQGARAFAEGYSWGRTADAVEALLYRVVRNRRAD
jgi:glycosyltransferase involved in cell wall biosynthesis